MTSEHCDYSCDSLDGRYTLTACTGAEEGPRQAPRAARWFRKRVFELRDNRNDARVWRVECRSSTPKQLWVSRGARAAVLCDDELFFVGPKGTISARIVVLEQLAKDQAFKLHAHPTESGLVWDEAPIGYFFECSGKNCFCLRPHWGTRLVFDSALATPVTADDAAAEHARAAEERWARDQLVLGRDRLREQGGCSPESAIRIGLASELVWREEFRTAIPLLREVETLCKVPTESADTPALDPNTVILSLLDPCTTRRATQEALLRLGEQPVGRPVYAPVGANGELLPAPPRPADWQRALRQVRPGMRVHDVMRLAGMPFFAGGVPTASGAAPQAAAAAEPTWEYDLLTAGADPETVRIAWANGQVANVETLRPAPWLNHPYRSTDLHRDGACLCMTGFAAGGFGPRD